MRGDQVRPIDYANASPDMALTSLHYYFPWAIKALLRWCTFCVVTGRRPVLDLGTRRYFEIGDREDLGYEDKLAAYRRLADEYFDTDRYHDFCASRLPHVDQLVLDWVDSADFNRLLVNTVRSTYPAHEHERFIAHLRGLVGQWVREQGRQPLWASDRTPDPLQRRDPSTAEVNPLLGGFEISERRLVGAVDAQRGYPTRAALHHEHAREVAQGRAIR